MPLSHSRTMSDPAVLVLEIDVSAANWVAADASGFEGGARALWVGKGGHVKVDAVGSGTAVFKNVPDGFPLPVSVSKVYMTGTTATDIVAIR